MSKKILHSFIATLLMTISAFTPAQTTITSNVRPLAPAFTGWDGTGPNSGTLEIRNDFNNNINLFTAGSQRMTIIGATGSTQGFVGIGTTTPSQRLDVSSDINLQTTITSRTRTNDGYRINNIK